MRLRRTGKIFRRLALRNPAGTATAEREQSAGYARRSHQDAVADAGSIPAVSTLRAVGCASRGAALLATSVTTVKVVPSSLVGITTTCFAHSPQRALVVTAEVAIGPANGLDQASVIACDHLTTIPADALGPRVGLLLDSQEGALSATIRNAFDLD